MSDLKQELEARLIVEQGEWLTNQSSMSYNKVRQTLKLLAQCMLVERATQGSTQAAIELSKAYPFNPSVNFNQNYSGIVDEILEYDDLTLDQIEVLKSKLSLCNKPLEAMTAEEIVDLNRKGKVNYNDAHRALTLLKMQQDIELSEVNGGAHRLEIFLTKEIEDSI